MKKTLYALIVDDYEDDAVLIARALEQGGFDLIFERVDTAEALRTALDRTAWDVIIADYSMPHFTGLDALTIAQDTGRDVPFILVSGVMGEEVAVEAMRLGAHDYVMKNNLKRLVPAVERELNEVLIRRERKLALNALHASEERYRKLFDLSPELVALLSLDATILDCNSAAEPLIGIPPEDLIGQSFYHLGILHEQDIPLAKQLMSQMSGGQPVAPVELSIIHRNGEPRWIEAYAVPVPDQDKIAAVQVICRDITGRKQSETKLRRYAERLEVLRQVDQAIAQSRSPQEIADAAVRHISQLVNCLSASVIMFDLEDNEAVLFANDLRFNTGIEPGTLFPLESYEQPIHILRSGQIFIADDIRQIARPESLWCTEMTKKPITMTALPLIFHDELLGCLCLLLDYLGRFDDEEIKVLRQLTDQLAIAISQARLYEDERRQRTRAEALRDMAATLNSTLDPDEVLNLILQQLRQVIPYDTASIQQITIRHIEVAAVQGDSRLVGFKSTFNPHSPYTRIFNEQKPLSIADITAAYPHLENSMVMFGGQQVRSWLGIPLIAKSRVIGFISLGRSQILPFTRDEIELAGTFASHAAVAIENAKPHRAVQLRANQLELVGQVSRRAAAILEVDEQLQQTVELIASTFGYTYTDVWLIEQDRLVLRAVSQPPIESLTKTFHLQIGSQGIVGWVAGHGLPLLVPDVDQDSRYMTLKEFDRATRSEMAVPMKLRGEVIGVVNVESEILGAFSQIDLVTLQAIADQLTVSLHNAQLYERIRRHADELEQRVQERTAELLRTKERVEAILSNSPDAILMLHAAGTISQVNQATVALFGYQPDELLSRSPADLMLPEHAAQLRQALRMASDLCQPTRIEMIARNQSGQTFDVDVAVAPILENNQVMNLICSIRDISALKEVERMKDAFVSNVSHELRTPITNLKLRQHLLWKMPDRYRDHLTVMERETDRLADIIGDLLYLSRMDQGRVPWRPALVNINRVASQYVEDRIPLAEDRHIALRFEGDTHLPDIWADESLIGQALSALLTNALNYTPADGQVQVNTRRELEAQQEWVTLNVSDNGLGIAPDEQPRLFERFYRGSAGLSSGSPGTGLGLSIVQEIVKKHQGRVAVISDGVPGHGTIFRLWLPVMIVE